MNSEELELSLRTEFESYLKNVLAEVRQEVTEFQKQFEAEYEKHKSQIDDVFQNFSARIAAEKELDAGFTDSVVEHLRLSRDEGARITATAIAEAEELDKQKSRDAAAAVNYSDLRDAINEISSKTTQSAILKTLVHHSASFTPRGAFFILKNEHLVGWRVFSKDGDHADEQTVREVFFPVASSTILGQAVRSLSPVNGTFGTYADDSMYLNKLGFNHPEHMHAIPLVVRGRAVAALYSDDGVGTGEVNVDALETLVRVAGLTVEVLASARSGHAPSESTDTVHEAPHEEVAATPAQVAPVVEEATAPTEVEASHSFVATEPAYSYEAPVEEPVAPVVEEETPEPSYSFDAPAEEPVAETEAETAYSFEAPAEDAYSFQPIEQPAETFETPQPETVEGDSFSFRANDKAPKTDYEIETTSYETESTWNAPVETNDYYSTEPAPSFEPTSYEAPTYEIPEAPAAPEHDYSATLKSNDYDFDTTSSYEAPTTDFEAAPSYDAPSFETTTSSYEAESFAPSTAAAYEPVAVESKTETAVAEVPVEVAAPVVEAAPAPKSRFSDRNVDLPIEVAEDERRLHNDARRFARLLVSEIKLYNEQKVKEGRESSDLYDRLREAIDRSREMYDKRVQPPVAAKFDYFHYELVSSLAEGDEARLGGSYPGAAV